MEPANLLSNLFQDPDAMQKLSGMAAELMHGTSAPSNPAAPSAEDAASPRRANASRAELLHALRPFLSEETCAQIAHAERILSMARMAKTAVRQFLPPDGRTKEI